MVIPSPYTCLYFGVEGQAQSVGLVSKDLYPSHVVKHGMVWALVEGTKQGMHSPWAVLRDPRQVGVMQWGSGVHNL